MDASDSPKCPYCGEPRSEYHWRGRLLRYNRTCGKSACVNHKHRESSAIRAEQRRLELIGRRRVDSDGRYVLVYTESGERAEHRVVMEEVVGRPLLSTEHVHHINHDKTDNRRENLMLFASAREHAEHHARDYDPPQEDTPWPEHCPCCGGPCERS